MTIQHRAGGDLVVAVSALAGQPVAYLMHFGGHGLREEIRG
jgi:hypothetical protein